MQHIPVLQEQSQPHPKTKGWQEGRKIEGLRKKGSNYKHEKKKF